MVVILEIVPQVKYVQKHCNRTIVNKKTKSIVIFGETSEGIAE